MKNEYRQISNIRCTLAGNKIVDHSDVVGASSPVGAAPTTSSFSTWWRELQDATRNTPNLGFVVSYIRDLPVLYPILFCKTMTSCRVSILMFYHQKIHMFVLDCWFDGLGLCHLSHNKSNVTHQVKLATNPRQSSTSSTYPFTGWIYNSLRPKKNGRHFPDHIFKHIFLNENL